MRSTNVWSIIPTDSTFGFNLIGITVNKLNITSHLDYQVKRNCASDHLCIVANLFFKPNTQSTLCTQNYPFRIAAV